MAVHLQGTERLLLRLPGWLGDLVAAEPVARALVERWRREGRAEALTLAGPGRMLELLRRAAPWAAGPGPTWVAVDGPDWPGALTRQDVVVLGTGSFRSALEARRAGVPRRVGWARDGRGRLLTDAFVPARESGRAPLGIGRLGRWPRRVPRPYGTSLAELTSQLGLSPIHTAPNLAADEPARARVAALLAGAGIEDGFLLVNLGGRDGSAKAYPAWGEALGRLAASGAAPALVAVAGPDEAARLDAARSALAAWPAPGLALGGAEAPDLVELVALAHLCGRAATTDTGPRHLFAAAGAPSLVLFGPTDPRHTADHLVATTSLVGRAPCGPCHLERCDQAGAGQLACWAGVDPSRVASELAAG